MKHPPIISFTAVNYISHVLRKNSLCSFNVGTEELLGEHNFNNEDSKTVSCCCTYMSKFLLYIIFSTKDRKSHYV